ncbi:hypothetical protein SHD_1791 [Shewanella decolorationis S12]|jgi:hypothetical protein|uniref:Uncharacterized protein n=1 Tax=Shewanella decolorationis S12 TaxID=1353536 RepID=A0ABN0PN58_9GAMM|nr:hypothetical protein SHD_1791 [Shewanella decolorationis S12]
MGYVNEMYAESWAYFIKPDKKIMKYFSGRRVN